MDLAWAYSMWNSMIASLTSHFVHKLFTHSEQQSFRHILILLDIYGIMNIQNQKEG